MSVAGNGAPIPGATDDDSRQKQTEPAVMDGLSSSKVTVEYHDPSGIFPLVQEDLTSRLPLRNLHWKSPTRPLRSIDSLHVDLVPSKESARAAATLAPPQGSSGTPIRTTEEILRPPVKEKERRHQIPGLRQTPYLKVYLLRCDDSETYKSTARKQVREWVKEHTPPSQSSSSSTNTQENHDAYEWMIIHVVVPDTPAAAQPRGSSSSTIGEKEKSGSSSRWTRGTTTLLEKLRADFNISSKSAPDRVAQIRLQKERVPPHLLPTPAAVATPPIAESPQEQDRAWSDVILKFKTLILLSFDLRVSQYEEDIRKNESQRSFPGWNFNTFFILKEGLARGFESVGLVEDALLGYDELSIGLDTVVRDQAVGESETQGATISNHSEDIREQVAMIIKSTSEAGVSGENKVHDDRPIYAQKKDYRSLILANNISIFDFRLYIFSRQMALLLRLGNSLSARSDLATKLQPQANAGMQQRSVDDSRGGPRSGDQVGGSEDLFSLAELCSRAINFITFAGRLLRDDVVNGATSHQLTIPEGLVDNVVRSWTFAALEQILKETATSSLPFTLYSKDASTISSGKSLAFGSHAKEQKIRVAEPKSMIHPSRSSSLNHGRSTGEPPYSQPTTSGQVVFENGQYHDRPAPNQESSLPQAKNGQQELAGFRAQLIAIQRRLLEQVGKTRGWKVSWAAILPALDQKEELSDVNLDEESEPKEAEDNDHETNLPSPILGISARALLDAVSSLEQFRQTYEILSDTIVKHYMAAGQHKSAESVLGDLAALRFETGDFAAAAAYFGRMASLSSSMFAQGRWNIVESAMLKMYAKCLKKLNRKDEYIRTLLDLLSKSAASRMASRPTSHDKADIISSVPKDWLNDDKVNTTGIFSELVSFSQQLPYDVTCPMTKYFSNVSVDPYLRHYEGKDGFQLRLQFRHILEDNIEIKAAKVHLISNSAQGKDIWMENTDTLELKKGIQSIWLGCNVNTIGPYMVDKIMLEAKRIIFVYEPLIKAEATTPLGIISSVSAHSLKAAKKARISCFPRPESFDARVYLSHCLHIDKPRHIEIECSSGWNEITCAKIRLKSASAGLRLRTANATVVSGDLTIEDQKTPGVIDTAALKANTKVTISVPYDMETILQDLTIKVEIDYETAIGSSLYLSSFTIPVELPLDVNVHDHFKRAVLLSKFNIKTANDAPLELLDVELQGSNEYDVHAPWRSRDPVYVFPKQPLAVTYKIMKKSTDTGQRRQSKLPSPGGLALKVEYRTLAEDVRDRVCQLFNSDIADCPAYQASRLLVHAFADRLEHKIVPQQYEQIALLNKVDIGSFEDIDWHECLEGLNPHLRDEAEAWLREWHRTNKTIHLRPGSDQSTLAPPSPYPARQMTITVSIPQTHILHTASLEPATHGISTQQMIATVGQPLPTTLRISHTRNWALPNSLISAANLTTADDAMDFTYTLEANPELWLIAGQRRGHFTAKENEVVERQVLLIPLRPGVALLPNIEIRATLRPKEDGKETEPLNSETDYLSYGDTVTVIPDVRSTTIGVGDMSLGSARSVVWLESTGA